jgi:ubiquinone/menaquinone biosynthesis C-methylase UbiE
MSTTRGETEIHDAEVIDQFTRQAEPFVQRHGQGKDALLDVMAECADASTQDTLLDVACGPGIVSCFFAQRVRHVTGLDMVPAMLERAQRLQAERHVTNVAWALGSSTNLPFPADMFDAVVTRFSFHHFLEPETALLEMKRVCKPGGSIVVCDSAPRKDAQTAFNHWEILRDPSHTRALAQAELEALGQNAGLALRRTAHYNLQMELDGLLAGSFPKEGDEARIRALFEADIQAGTDSLGVAARRESGQVRITYPVIVLAWRKPA